MQKEIVFNSNIAPASLPFRSAKYNVGAIIGGWGFNEKYEIPKNFKKLKVFNVKAPGCKELYGIDITSARNDSMCVKTDNNFGFGLCMVKTHF